MKNVNFYFIKNIAIRRWIYYAPFFLLLTSHFIPTFFDCESTSYIAQIICWLINVLFFIFSIALILKDNVELYDKKEINISLLNYFIVISLLFFTLIWVPIFSNREQLIEVLKLF
jgi:hypothetical protein